jgi:hypothetical protein
MMGMGFLRLNKLLAKHKWRRKDTVEDEAQESRESSLALWLVVMALLVLSVLIFGVWHTSQFF